MATTHAVNHDWISTGILESRFGTLKFKQGYPTVETSRRLADALTFNRAVEVYLSEMPAVSFFRVWKAVAEAGAGAPNQLIIWERLMDAATLLLTGNSETVYALAAIDLKRDGPTIIEVPPMMLGGVSNMWQGEVLGIGPTGGDRGRGGSFLLLPPDFHGSARVGYMAAKSPTYGAVLGLRGFLVDGQPDEAVTLMKSTRIHSVSQTDRPPAMTFVNGSGKEIDTIFADTLQFFEDLAELIDREPADIVTSHERFRLAAIGIEKGKPFRPDSARRRLLGEAARVGSAAARGMAYASTDPERLPYADRKWEWLFTGGSPTWDAQGYVNTDRRAAFGYAAIGMSPAMVQKVVGSGSQYFWTPRDASGAFLDGGRSYRLHLPPKIPVRHFWSVVVYDAESRSMLRNSQKFPSVSQYTGPAINSDGSVDVYFGPKVPKDRQSNWVHTIDGKGWFPLLRFYGPLQPFFDKTWKPGDIEPVG